MACIGPFWGLFLRFFSSTIIPRLCDSARLGSFNILKNTFPPIFAPPKIFFEKKFFRYFFKNFRNFPALKRPLCCRWIPNTAKSSRNAKGKAWFSCKIVGTADFQTLKWPLCYRLIPDMTTLPGPSGPATFKQKCYFSRLILHLHGTQSCILNRKRTKSNLEKQRST